MVGAPSVAVDLTPSYRISLVRAGDGPDAAWLAEVDDLPNCSATGSTPEEAVRRAWAAAEESLGHSPPAPRHSGKLLVRMPATLHDELARTAEGEGVSLNQLITGVLAGAVEWRSAGGSGAPARHQGTGDTRTIRLDRIALFANFTVVAVVAFIAVALLVMAWRG